MPETAELEIRTIEGRELRIRRRLARFGEWLAWTYVAAPSGLHNEGLGFEARAASPEAATEELVEKVRAHLRNRNG